MAEVVAKLDIDSGDAIQHLKDMGAQFVVLEGGTRRVASTLEHEFGRAGNAFEHHLLSMRAAAGALLGGLSIAGVIYEAKTAIEGLGERAFKASGDFEKLNASMTVFHGEVNGLILALPGIRDLFHDIADFPLVFGAALDTLREHPFSILAYLGLDEIPSQAEWNAIGEDFEKHMGELRRKRDALLTKPPSVVRPFALPDTFLRAFGAESMPDFSALHKGLTDATDPLSRFSPFAEQAADRLEKLHSAMIGIKSPLVDLSEQFKLLPNSTQITVAALTDVWKEMELLQQKYQQVGEVANVAMGMLSAASAAGILSASGFARLQMALLSVQATQHGMYEMAAAVGSAASYDYRGALLHKIAAGLYFATAAFEGIGAIRGSAAGAGGGSSGSGGSFQSAQFSSPPPQRSISVELTLEGDVYGVGKTRDEFARELAADLKRAIQDGAAGGTIG